MNDDKTNLTNEPSNINWSTTSSIPNDVIEKYAHDILETPSTNDGGKDYYNRDQLIGMFRLGAATVTDKTLWKQFVDVKNGRTRGTYRRMRSMRVGETVTFPYSEWNAARSAASKLKKDFGCRFTVKKQGYLNCKGTIRVLRCQ